MTFKTVNSRPRPRALFQDLPDDLIDTLSPLFPTVEIVTRGDSVHAPEFDVLITASTPVDLASHLHVVAFGTVPPVPPARTLGLYQHLARRGTSFAREMSIPEMIDPSLRDLIVRDLVPCFRELHPKPTFVLQNRFAGLDGRGLDTSSAVDAVEPFLLAGSDGVLAGRFDRGAEIDGKSGRIWFLPLEVKDHAAWVRAALRDFHEIDPESVPSLPDWWMGGTFRTPQQEEADAVLRSAELERIRLIASLDDAVIEAQEALRAVTEAGLAGPLRLLTESGDALVKEVANSLTVLGFEVLDMDEVYPTGDRREDLQVRLSGYSDWVALVEVKGYRQGAAVNDLARLERFAGRYAVDHKQLPSAKWHIVNICREENPAERPVAIPNDADLHEFADGGGVLIDTRDLFRAWKATTQGFENAEWVRSSLTTAKGRWTYPTSAEG